VTDKIYGLAMVPNRSTPKRYVRLISYVRSTFVDDDGCRVDVVVPYLYEKRAGGESSAHQIPYSRIRGYPADPEMVEQWAAHLRSQAVRDSRSSG
jgi:hypothetical protein